MYEGVLWVFNFGCFWDVVEKYGVIIFYIVFIVIRVLMKMGE